MKVYVVFKVIFNLHSKLPLPFGESQKIHPLWWIQASLTSLLLELLHLLPFITALRMSEYHPLHLSPNSPHQGSFTSIQLTAKRGDVLRLSTKGLIVSISGKTETTLDLGITMTLDMIAMYQWLKSPEVHRLPKPLLLPSPEPLNADKVLSGHQSAQERVNPPLTFQLTHAPSPQDCHARKCFPSLKGFRQYSSQHVLGVPKKVWTLSLRSENPMLGIPACISSLLDPVQTPSPCSHRTSYRTEAWEKNVLRI